MKIEAYRCDHCHKLMEVPELYRDPGTDYWHSPAGNKESFYDVYDLHACCRLCAEAINAAERAKVPALNPLPENETVIVPEPVKDEVPY